MIQHGHNYRIYLGKGFQKLGNTCEQLFHVWKSFNFDENTETTDSYVMQMRQVATLLGYGEPQILEYLRTLCQQNYIGSYFQ